MLSVALLGTHPDTAFGRIGCDGTLPAQQVAVKDSLGDLGPWHTGHSGHDGEGIARTPKMKALLDAADKRRKPDADSARQEADNEPL